MDQGDPICVLAKPNRLLLVNDALAICDPWSCQYGVCRTYTRSVLYTQARRPSLPDRCALPVYKHAWFLTAASRGRSALAHGDAMAVPPRLSA